MSRLVVVSNRIAPPDEHAASAGGLAVGILGALKAAGGLWFGWSGETGNEDQPLKKVKKGNITWASLTSANRTLTNTTTNSPMPFSGLLFHYRLDLVQFQRPAWDGYLRVNALLADKLLPLLQDDDIIWIHDYHLPFAHELRKRGVNNRIGFFCIFLSRHRKSSTRCRHMTPCLNSFVIMICWVSRQKTIVWRSWIAFLT